MPRRGQCRCGLILTFQRTAHGYKMRCPSCGAVVRLRVDMKRRRPPTPPDEFDVELLPPWEVPAEFPAAPARSRRGLLALVLAGAALLGVMGGAAWWFLH